MMNRVKMERDIVCGILMDTEFGDKYREKVHERFFEDIACQELVYAIRHKKLPSEEVIKEFTPYVNNYRKRFHTADVEELLSLNQDNSLIKWWGSRLKKRVAGWVKRGKHEGGK